MRFAICDDEPMHIQLLEKYFAEQKEFEIKSEAYTKGETLLEEYKENNAPYDAIFLDMEMPGLNGLETANAIRAIDDRVFIIFVTNYEKYAIESFQCEPLDFLLKPVQFDKLYSVIERIHFKIINKRATITFYNGMKYIRLYCDQILYFESARNYTLIHTKDETYRVRVTAKEIEEKLEIGHFARCHRSYCVNLGEVKTIDDDGYIHLYHSSDTIHIGDVYRKNFMRALIDYELK